jgi:peptidyl-prolyl cis-trans isomerase D
VRAGAAAPDALAKPLLRWLLEQRAATLVTLRPADAPEPPAPTEAQLRRFHENNPERFSTPEYRDATVAVLSADRLMREVEVTEAEIAAAYEARPERFVTPERRALEQVLVQDEATAREIAALWRGGADFAAVTAAAEAAGGSALDLGLTDRAGLPLPELADPAFALPQGGVSDPVRTPFGWHVLRVSRIEPGQTRPLAEARETLRREIAAEKAADIAFERANRVEDALAGGATLAEAAERFNLGFAQVTTDAQGLRPDGQPVELPVIEAAREPLLRAVFSAAQGAPPRLRETEAGFVAVDVRSVTPPALRPFEAVEPAVREAFLADARRRAQEERATALLAAVRTGGKTLAEAAREAGLGSREVGGIGRDPRQAGAVPAELIAPLFELKQGEATMVPTRDGGFAVAQVTEITGADPEAPANADTLAALRREAEQAVAQDLELQFLAALRERADARVNPRLVEQLARP